MDAVTYTIGGFIKTMGANTAPANDDAKIGMRFTFENAGGTDIIPPVFIEADQSAADVDWAEYTTEVLLSEVPANVYAECMRRS